MSRTSRWWQKRRDEGVGLAAWNWFPDPDRPTRNLADAIRHAAQEGAESYILNAEAAFRGRRQAALRLAGAAAEFCDREGIAMGFTSFGFPANIRDFPWQAFAEMADYGVPQLYRDEPDPGRGLAQWARKGFTFLVPAVGLHGPRGTGWRPLKALRGHLAAFPGNSLRTRIAWPLPGVPPADLLAELYK